LQQAWAREHGVSFNRKNWLKEIVLAQVKDFRPDVLFLQDLYLFDHAFRQQLRQHCSDRVILIGFRAAPTADYSPFKDLDLVLTVVPNFAERLRESGANVEILRHAFETSVLDVVPPAVERDLDFTFIGSLVLRDGFHHERYALLEKLLQFTSLQVWGHITEPPSETRTGQVLSRLTSRADRSLQRLGVPNRQRDQLLSIGKKLSQKTRITPAQREAGSFHEPVYGLDNFRVLGRSKITFNNHIDCADAYAGNMRLFEATGMGACLVTDWKINLPELFQPDTEVVTYKSAEECADKVNYLLEHDEERRSIAAAGQVRTLRDHTLRQRIVELDEMIKQLLARRGVNRSSSVFTQV
jgi:spore maturation protein CgeB